MSDFAYYYIEISGGKIVKFYKNMNRDEPEVPDSSKIIRSTANEYNLLKYLNGDIELGNKILSGEVPMPYGFLDAVNNDAVWAQTILDDYEETISTS